MQLQDIFRELNKISSELRIARTELDNPFEDHHAKWYDWAYKDSLKKPDYVDGYLLERSVSTSNRMKDLARALDTLSKKVEDPTEEDVDKAMRALPFLRSKIENVLRGMAVLDGAASAVSHMEHLKDEQAREEEFSGGPHKDHHYWSSDRSASIERDLKKNVSELAGLERLLSRAEDDVPGEYREELLTLMRMTHDLMNRLENFSYMLEEWEPAIS